ncbi:MAG: 2-nitropropane dioxygenase [Peptococcaceae bacterium]|jgi:enoyl-[acyl-carrier protein] reductase II|nr:2-nitropropane dioxygenase [Peptococcaceae bacterium]
MKTRLTELLGIEYPIIQGGMAWISEATLAGAVSQAGGAGVIATGGRDIAWVREEIRKVKAMTDKPFGVNIALLWKNKEEIIDVVCEEGVSFVTLGAGNPVPYIEKLHKAGIKVLPVIPNVKLAKRVEENGADAIIIEGMEAGGHIGTLTTMALMTQVIPAVKIPVVVAGGIVDGRGLAAALIMGGEGIQMGTRFLASKECQAHPNFKKRLLEAVDTDSVVTGYSRGHGVRGLKNEFTEKYLALERAGAPQEELDRLATGTNRLAAVEGDVVNGLVQAGQSLTPITKILPVQEIIETIVREAREILLNAPKLVK